MNWYIQGLIIVRFYKICSKHFIKQIEMYWWSLQCCLTSRKIVCLLESRTLIADSLYLFRSFVHLLCTIHNYHYNYDVAVIQWIKSCHK